MKQIITDELFEVVVSLRFASNYKRQVIRESPFMAEFNHSAFVEEFSVQLWSVNQRTAEAGEVTASLIHKQVSDSGENTRSPVRDGASLSQPWTLSCYNWL
jgi:hypothetical protein